MSIDVNDLLTRVTQLGVDALANLSPAVTAYAIPYLNHTQSQFPYFVSYVASWNDNGNNFEISQYVLSVGLRLIVGNRDSNTPGKVEQNLYTYMFAVPEYINKHVDLQTSTDTTDVPDLMYAQCLQGDGTKFFGDSNVGTTTVGTTYIVECHFEQLFEQSAY